MSGEEKHASVVKEGQERVAAEKQEAGRVAAEKAEKEQSNLIAAEKVVCVGDDGGKLQKRVLRAGNGDKPVHGATVAVHYVISLHATGVVIDRTFAEEIAKDDADAAAQVQAEDQRDDEEGEEEGEEEVDRKPFMFRMGRPGIIKGMQRAVASMQLNEHAEFIVAPELAYGATGNPPKVPANAELRLNVELVSFTTEEKVWDSEGLSKTFLELGTGHNRPNEDAEVVVDFEVRVGATHVGDVIFKGEGVRFVLGEYTKLPTHTTAPDATTERDTKEGEAGRETPDIECIKNLQGLQEAVQSMLVDEQAEFVVSPSHGFGDTDKMPSVRAKGVDKDSSLHMVLRLRAFTKGRETWQMNLDEKVERMVYRKQQGNFFYRRLRGPADIERAIMFYTKALNLFRYDEHLSEEEKGKVNGVRKLCFFNIAQCRFKQKDFGAAIQGYKSMLEFDETHIRALIRRGQCFAYIGEYEEAQTDFRRALEVDAANQDALAWLESVGKLIKKQEKKERAMAVKMFAS